VFTLEQADAAGVSSGHVYRGVQGGAYVRLLPGVLAVTGSPDGRERRWLAAQLSLGPGAVLSHQTAADIHGLEHRLPNTSRIHFTVAEGHPRRRQRFVIHRTSNLHPDDVTTVGRFEVTSVTRTLCDVAGEVDPERLRKIVAAGVREGHTSAELLRSAVARRERFPGRAALRRVVDELSPLEPCTREELESLFLRITTAANIAPTHMNLPVEDADGVTRYIDAAWLPEGVFVELDSRTYHGTLLDWHDDLRRENAVKLGGWQDPLRFSYADLRHRPEEVVEVVRLGLARARADLGLAPVE
jgi:hypothetical protein